MLVLEVVDAKIIALATLVSYHIPLGRGEFLSLGGLFPDRADGDIHLVDSNRQVKAGFTALHGQGGLGLSYYAD